MPPPFGDAMTWEAAGMPDVFSSSIEPNYQPFGDSSFLGGNLGANLMLGAGMQWLFGGQGYLPGQLMPNQNMFDQIRARQHAMTRYAATRAGFQQDEASTVQLMRGFSQMMGRPFGMDQLRAAGNIASGLTEVMPFIAPMAPLTFDAMFGGEGSQGIAAMALGARREQEVDPVTGRMGLSEASISGRAEHLFNRLYRQGGPGQGYAEMRGLGVGAAASALVEMERRGMAGQSVGSMGAREQADALGVTLEELRAKSGATLHTN